MLKKDITLSISKSDNVSYKKSSMEAIRQRLSGPRKRRLEKDYLTYIILSHNIRNYQKTSKAFLK